MFKLSSGKEKGQLTTVIRQMLPEPSIECLTISGTDAEDWLIEIRKLMQEPDTGHPIRPGDACKIARYVLVGDDLYKRGFFTPLLKCLARPEALYVLDKLHNGICGFHTGQRTLKARVIQAGYYWPTMEEDAKSLVQKCEGCQAYANIHKAPPSKLHAMVSPWSFTQWGNGHCGTPSWTSEEEVHFGRHRLFHELGRG
ncbi:uncharacterized protein LOC108344002 [Vigna angularis]|uniref:uncharacterized protein LOC108344002 n=1 Tax=Phaseolus angularis TaxID=3914 RepID=UPI000809B38B|nr:uncharacterized protein LOC108344002 [Vigna angularis]